MEGEDEYYEVEHILDVRQTKKGAFEIKIKWLGYNSPEDDTWEPYTNLNQDTCFFFLREYRAKLQANLVVASKPGKTALENKLKLLNKIMRAWKKILNERNIEFNDSEKRSALSEDGLEEPRNESNSTTPQKNELKRNERIIDEDDYTENTIKEARSRENAESTPTGIGTSAQSNVNQIYADYSKVSEPSRSNPFNQGSAGNANDKSNLNNGKGKSLLETLNPLEEDEGYKIKHKNNSSSNPTQNKYVPQPPPPINQKKMTFNRNRQENSNPYPQKASAQPQPSFTSNQKQTKPSAQEQQSQSKGTWKWIKNSDENRKFVEYLQNPKYSSIRLKLYKTLGASQSLQKSTSSSHIDWHIDDTDQMIYTPASQSSISRPSISIDDLIHYDPKTAFNVIYRCFKATNEKIEQFADIARCLLKAGHQANDEREEADN